MPRKLVGPAISLLLCLTISVAHGQGKGKGSEKPGEHPGAGKSAGKPGEKHEPGKPGGNPGGKPEAGKPGPKPPGGNWSETKPNSSNQHKEAEGAAAANHNAPKTTGAQGAAAGVAAANHNAPKTSGAEGAAAGAAAVNRNSPKATGAEGAAAGAAAANHNAPKASGAEGAAAGAAIANHNAPAASGAAGAAAGYASVRNSFDRHDMYNAEWYGTHAGAWSPTSWPAGAAWNASAWAGLANHFGYGNNPPISYNYGTNITCVNGNVLRDGQNIGTAEDFSQQASDLAQAGAAAETLATDKWVSLGVFALVRNEQQHPQLILQLALNQNGTLRGNYTDETTDNTLPIRGALDQKSQRLAWTVGNNTSNVMEAGLSNLTQGEATTLLHKNGKTEKWILVRLQPKQ